MAELELGFTVIGRGLVDMPLALPTVLVGLLGFDKVDQATSGAVESGGGGFTSNHA